MSTNFNLRLRADLNRRLKLVYLSQWLFFLTLLVGYTHVLSQQIRRDSISFKNIPGIAMFRCLQVENKSMLWADMISNGKNNDYNLLLIKFDSAWQIIWQKEFATQDNNRPIHLAVDAQGNYVIASRTSFKDFSTNPYSDYGHVWRITPTGDILANVNLGRIGVRSRSLLVEPEAFSFLVTDRDPINSDNEYANRPNIFYYLTTYDTGFVHKTSILLDNLPAPKERQRHSAGVSSRNTYSRPGGGTLFRLLVAPSSWRNREICARYYDTKLLEVDQFGIKKKEILLTNQNTDSLVEVIEIFPCKGTGIWVLAQKKFKMPFRTHYSTQPCPDMELPANSFLSPLSAEMFELADSINFVPLYYPKPKLELYFLADSATTLENPFPIFVDDQSWFRKIIQSISPNDSTITLFSKGENGIAVTSYINGEESWSHQLDGDWRWITNTNSFMFNTREGGYLIGMGRKKLLELIKIDKHGN